eukprot:scaffold35436_cov66-Phaeocystis_antarctica.AAC.5
MALGVTLVTTTPAPRPCWPVRVPFALPPPGNTVNLVEVVGASGPCGVLIIASTCLHLQRAP